MLKGLYKRYIMAMIFKTQTSQFWLIGVATQEENGEIISVYQSMNLILQRMSTWKIFSE